MTTGGRISSNPPRTRRELLSFGGVAFELLAEERLQCGLPTEHRRHCPEGADARAIADVVCAVQADPALPQQVPWVSNEVRWTCEDAGDAHPSSLIVRGKSLQARIEQVGARRYAVTAGIGIAPDEEGYLALLRGVSGAIVHREGGLVLHAAAVELQGQAVLFVGPSGAGKSTAVRHTDGGRCFADDHVAVVPSAAGWLAWGLPGGTTANAPLAEGIVFPLAAVLRVRQGARAATPSWTLLRGTAALFALRESVKCADDSPGAEDTYLRTAMQLASTITVGSIETVLGRPLSSILRTLPALRGAPSFAITV